MQLYAITDNSLIKDDFFVETVEKVIIGGAKIIQYRDKSHDQLRRLQQAQALLKLCQKYKIPLLINDDVALAQQVGANGVHLGKNDTDISIARAKLGNKAIIGVSCYNQLSLAKGAVNSGADYVAFGRIFQSRTKPEANSCSLKLLSEARQQLSCPIVAIGGITSNNANLVMKAGADYVAVIHGLFGQIDVLAAAQAYNL